MILALFSLVDTYYQIIAPLLLLTQSAHIIMLFSYWFSLLNLSLLHMSRLRSQQMFVGNTIFVSWSEAWSQCNVKQREDCVKLLLQLSS